MLSYIKKVGIRLDAYRQFPLSWALRLSFSDLARKLCNPNSVFSYSQAGEDRVIEHILNKISPGSSGFYVDVGCHHPFRISNTFRLYKRGWNGLNIDPNPDLIDLFRKIRPKDISVCAAISDKNRIATWYLAADAAESSLSAEFISERLGQKAICGKFDLVTQTLGDLLNKYQVPNRFELLNIDVEGHDYEVITSFDINLYRPKLIVVEIFAQSIFDLHLNRIANYLKDSDYIVVGYDTKNGYFVDGHSNFKF